MLGGDLRAKRQQRVDRLQQRRIELRPVLLVELVVEQVRVRERQLLVDLIPRIGRRFQNQHNAKQRGCDSTDRQRNTARRRLLVASAARREPLAGCDAYQ